MDPLTVSPALRAATELARRGDLAGARRALPSDLDDLPPEERSAALALSAAAGQAAGRHDEAIGLLTERVALDPGDRAAFDLGLACFVAGRDEDALRGLLPLLTRQKPNGRWFLFAGAALWRAARRDEALSVWSLGADRDPAVRVAWRHPEADTLTRRASQVADAALRRHFSDLHRRTTKKQERIAEAIWVQTHDQPFEMTGEARPHTFYVPSLPQKAFWTATDWLGRLRDVSAVIAAEFAGARGEAEAFAYVSSATGGAEWEGLRGSDDWTALSVFKDGQATGAFPRTADIVRSLPTAALHGTPIEAFFSRLAPATHVPPHHGLSNARLTVHLPLIVPSGGARLRVGDHLHHLREGEPYAFDDSWAHEAWNDGDAERVVLICEAWRPELDEAERTAVEASYEARHDWLARRRVPSVRC